MTSLFIHMKLDTNNKGEFMKTYILTVFLLLGISPVQTAFSQTSPESSSESKNTQTSADAHFLDMMTEHHRDGIKMTELATQKAQSKEIKTLAQKILKDQKEELKQMEIWRDRKFSNESKMEAMSEPMDVSKLESAKGKDFDKQFADMMIQHHKDGIKMAKDSSPQLRDGEIKNFVGRMIKNQTKEEEQLQKISSSLDTAKKS